MKRGVISGIVFIFLINLVNAAPCDLNANLVSQNPYPAMPGEYVELVFQVTGVENPECGKVTFELIEKFPFSLDEGRSNKYEVLGGIYNLNYKNFLLAPYKVIVDKNAIEGDNELKIIYYGGGGGNLVVNKGFNISIEDVRTDFEVSIKDYDYDTNILTLEVLNFGEHDAESLVVEIPNQENIAVKGSSRFIVGSLDANEDTTFTYEAIPMDGDINLKVYYTDEISERREIDKTITFDSSYFTNRKRDEQTAKPASFYVSVILAALIILGFIYNRIRHRRRRMIRAAERR